MNRLIKGAENSLSASSELFSKNTSNLTGDLSNNVQNKGGGLLMTRSKEEYGADMGSRELTSMGELNLGEGSEADFGDLRLSQKGESSQDVNQKPSTVIPRYSHIKTALVKSLADLDDQVKNMEFRNVFRLSHMETISVEELNCHYYAKQSNTFMNGNMYLSQNFLNFAAFGNSIPLVGIISTSMLFDSPSDPALVFVIPFAHIVSVKKQPLASLASATKLAISLSGYLVVSTKNKMEFWFSFSSSKARDKMSDEIFLKIKAVDWKFDEDMIIGGRNGPPLTARQSLAGSKERGSLTSLHSNISIDNSPTLLSDKEGKKIDIHTHGLKFLNPIIGKDGNTELDRYTQTDVNKWTEYFDSRGRDVCIIKDMKVLRDLINSTAGLPDIYRGDFWMLVSGAWYSKPAVGYYQGLLNSNKHKKNPFEEEIEKDVRR
jgi:GRAM domain